MIKIIDAKITLTISLQDDFIKFLKDHNSLEKYARCFQNRFLTDTDSNGASRFFTRNCPEGWISSAFVWDETTFWRDLSKAWNDFLQETVLDNIEIEEKGVLVKSWKVADLSLGVRTLLTASTKEASLAGRMYRVCDNSYNREASPAWEQESWRERDERRTWINIIDKYGTNARFIILSETPETKIIDIWGEDHPTSMIKIWLPNEQKAQWVLFRENWVVKDEIQRK